MLERIKRRFGDRVEGRVVAMGFDSVRYVRPVRPEVATGIVATVYEQLTRDFQLVAPLTLTSPLPPLLAAGWTCSRNAGHRDGSAARKGTRGTRGLESECLPVLRCRACAHAARWLAERGCEGGGAR
jgi:hypothetical protein